MNVRILRKENPRWTFVPVRRGFSWTYIGNCGKDVIRIFPVAILISEDDFEVEWRVDTGKVSKTYSSWFLEQNFKEG